MAESGEVPGGDLTQPTDKELGMNTDLWYSQAVEAGGDLMIVADIIAAERARRLALRQQQNDARTLQIQNQAANMIITDYRTGLNYFAR